MYIFVKQGMMFATVMHEKIVILHYVEEKLAMKAALTEETEELGMRLALEKTILLAKVIGNFQFNPTNKQKETEFIALLFKGLRESCMDGHTLRDRSNDLNENIKLLYKVARIFQESDSSKYPPLFPSIDMELSTKALRAVDQEMKANLYD